MADYKYNFLKPININQNFPQQQSNSNQTAINQTGSNSYKYSFLKPIKESYNKVYTDNEVEKLNPQLAKINDGYMNNLITNYKPKYTSQNTEMSTNSIAFNKKTNEIQGPDISYFTKQNADIEKIKSILNSVDNAKMYPVDNKETGFGVGTYTDSSGAKHTINDIYKGIWTNQNEKSGGITRQVLALDNGDGISLDITNPNLVAWQESPTFKDEISYYKKAYQNAKDKRNYMNDYSKYDPNGYEDSGYSDKTYDIMVNLGFDADKIRKYFQDHPEDIQWKQNSYSEKDLQEMRNQLDEYNKSQQTNISQGNQSNSQQKYVSKFSLTSNDQNRLIQLQNKQKLAALSMSEKNELNNLLNRQKEAAADIERQKSAVIKQYDPKVDKPIDNSLLGQVKRVINAGKQQADYETYDPNSPYSHDVVNKALYPLRLVGDTIQNIPIVNRFLGSADEALGVQPQDVNGNPKEKMSTGNKIVDKITDMAGTLGGYGAMPGPNGVSPLNFTDDASKYIAKTIENKTAQSLPGLVKTGESLYSPALNAANKILPAFVRGAIDNGVFTAAEDIGNGKYLKTTAKDTALNTLIGGGLSLGGKAVSDFLKKEPKVNTEAPKDTKLTSELTPIPVKINGEDSTVIGFSKMRDGKQYAIADNGKGEIKMIPREELDSYRVENASEPVQATKAEVNTNTPVESVTAPTEEMINNATDVKELDRTISQLDDMIKSETNPQRKMMLSNLQLLAQQKKKALSKVYSNTLQKTTVLTDAEKKLLKPKDFKYTKISEEDSLANAQKRIDGNVDKEIDNLNKKDNYTGEDVDTMMGLIDQKLLKEARETGDYTKVINMLKNVRKAGTTGGQTVQAFAKYSRTAEGKLAEAQSVVDSVEKEVKKRNPKVIEAVEKDTKAAEKSISKAKEEAVKEAVPEELLANKVSSTVKEGKSKSADIVKDMVDELYRVAKESPLPEKAKAVKRNPIDFLKQAIENKGQYGGVWEKAKNLVKEKYTDDPEALAVLDNYFNKGIIPTYSDKTLTNSVKVSMQDLGIILDNIARSPKAEKEAALKELTDYLINTTGAANEDAAALANSIQSKYETLVKEKSESILKQMFKDVPARQQKTLLQKVQELINLGAYDKESIRDLIKEKKGLPVLDNEDIKFITEHMDKYNELPEGYAKEKEFALVRQRIGDKVPPTLRGKISSLRNISLLGNPLTATKNITGNVFMGSGDLIGNSLSATIYRPLDKFMSKFTGQRSVAFPSLKTLGKSSLKGIKESIQDTTGGLTRSELKGKPIKQQIKDILNGLSNPINTNSLGSEKFEGTNGMQLKSKPLRIIENFVNTSLEIGDRPFSQAYYDDVINQLKKSNKTDIVTEEMKAVAKKVAEERTYQDVNSISALAMGLKNLPKKIQDQPRVASAIQIFLDSMLPYMKTPANIIKRGIEYTPEGIIEGILKLGFGIKDGTLKNSPERLLLQRQIMDRISRGTVGTGILLGGMALAKSGNATGAANKDKDIAAMEKSLGKQTNAIKIGNTYRNYDWAAPLSMPFGAGVQAVLNKTGSDPLTSGADTVTNILNYYADQPMLQGLQKLLGSSNSSQDQGMSQRLLSAGIEIPKQFVPTAAKQVAQLTDPFNRETYSNNYLQNNLLNQLKVKTPEISKQLPAKTDTLGREMKNYQGNNNALNVLLKPWQTTTYNPNDVETEVLRLANAGYKEQMPRVAPKQINYTVKDEKTGKNISQTYTLNGKEYTDYQKLIGSETLKEFANIVNSSYYQSKDDEEKVKLLSNTLTKINAKAKNVFIKDLQDRGVIKK